MWPAQCHSPDSFLHNVDVRIFFPTFVFVSFYLFIKFALGTCCVPCNTSQSLEWCISWSWNEKSDTLESPWNQIPVFCALWANPLNSVWLIKCRFSIFSLHRDYSWIHAFNIVSLAELLLQIHWWAKIDVVVTFIGPIVYWHRQKVCK